MSSDTFDRECFSNSAIKSPIDDWHYEMRREMQEILPGLYLGPLSVCRDKDYLRNFGITHILCILDTNELNLFKRTLEMTTNFNSHIIQIADNQYQLLISHFPIGNKFIKQALDQGGKVLVCCNGGMSRSPCFAIAYIMETFQMDAREAYHFVQSKRLCINPNDSFKSQLRVVIIIIRKYRIITIYEYTHNESKG
ncbi:protein-tyrosine phosphatase-like protein [Cunninghamella echinulata]|nr:protein-tyrosine phosphatase-like protein [Cunninghamella echinulata]